MSRTSKICGATIIALVTASVPSLTAQAAAEYSGLASQAAAVATPATGQQQSTPAAQAPTQPPAATSGPQDTVQSTQAESATAAPLRLLVGKSILVKTADKIRRVSVTDPTVADAIVVTTNQILVHGRSPGEVSLIVWNEHEESRNFDLRVDVDVTAAGEEIHRIFPDQKIDISASRSAIVLSGHVATKDIADRAAALATAYSKNTVSVLTFGPVGAEEILLEVKFAEVDRTALAQWGFNLFSTGAGNTFGATSTQQFGGFTGSNVGSVTSDVKLAGTPAGNNLSTGEIGNHLTHQPASIGFNNLLNFFLFRSDLNLGAVVQALQNRNILQILAEPNLIAVNGKEASFLAGGEFPYPVPQGITGSITIQFKEFGVRLSFIPVVMPNGAIHLQVKPEVSSLDFSNALTTNGFVIPAISTRRAETEFELMDGQSFVIAGLLDNRVTDISNKVPGLGDLPILGTFFKSKNQQKTKTELMVLVTAHKVNPLVIPKTLPTFPKPFLDSQKLEQPANGSHK